MTFRTCFESLVNVKKMVPEPANAYRLTQNFWIQKEILRRVQSDKRGFRMILMLSVLMTKIFVRFARFRVIISDIPRVNCDISPLLIIFTDSAYYGKISI